MRFLFKLGQHRIFQARHFQNRSCDIRYGVLWTSTGECFISTSDTSGNNGKEIRRVLARVPVVSSACDLDLLLFLHRHPRTLLTSEQLAAFVGYAIQGIAKSLETFIEADLLERTQNPMHAARMYLLVLDGPQNGGIRELLKLASTRSGRHSVLEALYPGGSRPETEAPKQRLRLVKFA